jgi:hypothetical protein
MSDEGQATSRKEYSKVKVCLNLRDLSNTITLKSYEPVKRVGCVEVVFVEG